MNIDIDMIDKNSLTLFIKKWVLSMIKGEPNLDLLSSNFKLDNGLNLNESIAYELKQYNLFANKSDLNSIFDVSIDNIIYQSNNIFHIYYSVINEKDIKIFKWQVTIEIFENNLFFITGNNYLSQIVHKLNIDFINNSNYCVSGFNLAIKVEQNYHLTNIVSPIFELQNISKPSSYEEDGFHLASFLIKDSNVFSHINETKLKLIYTKENKHIIENRIIPLNFKVPLAPFILKDDKLHINNEHYPFHIYIEYTHKPSLNLFHPKDLIIPLNKDITKLIITDCLDNDWCII